jgi:hypothetical protein
MKKIKIHQICYSSETLNKIPDRFLTLDNLSNNRPDWREYWPIRNFLLENQLDDDSLYGFFSPKFSHKTGLNFNDIEKFIDEKYTNEDVVMFSPYWDLLSLFKNTFEQGEVFHPGLILETQNFVNHINFDIDISNHISHSRNTVFCNYFLATPSFWKEWLVLGEKLFDYAENKKYGISELTTYGKERVPMKVFVMERIVNLISLKHKKKCLNFDIFKLNPSDSVLNKLLYESIICDSLKVAYDQTGYQIYLNQFAEIRLVVNNYLNSLVIPPQN